MKKILFNMPKVTTWRELVENRNDSTIHNAILLDIRSHETEWSSSWKQYAQAHKPRDKL